MNCTFACLAAAAAFVPALLASTNPPPGGTDFGFSGKEVFPVDNFIGLMHAADVNGDGKMDLVLVNNARSRINLLINQTGLTNASTFSKPGVKREINDLPPDARFRIDSIASEKRIGAMAVEDLNSDGRPDIAYYGEPKELIVLFNDGTNGWRAPKRWPIDDGQLTPNALSAGDLNGDGRTDLLLLADKYVHYVAQRADGSMGEPEKIPLAAPARAARAVDVNGDGRHDLLLVNWESATPFRFRLQNKAGQLGPEMFFTFPAIRSYFADDLVAKAGTQIISIAQQSGRAQISRFTRKPAPALLGSFSEGQLQVLPVAATEKSRRGIAWADVNGDKLEDLLVAEPESGQLSLHLQQDDGSLAPSKSFPSLAGVSEIAVTDWDQDGHAEVFLLSPEEKQVGVTRLDDKGRLPFPTLVQMDGKPLTMALGAPKAGGRPVLAVIADQDGKRALITRTSDGATRVQNLSESFKSNPSMAAWHDVDQDGLNDLVVLIPYEKVKVLIQTADNRFEETDVAPPGGAVEQPWLAMADADSDGRSELLLPQKNFLRAVVLKRKTTPSGVSTNAGENFFDVRDQINGAASNSRITGAAMVPGTNGAGLFLLDSERKMLTLTQRDSAGVWQVVRNVTLPVAQFHSIQPIALGSIHPNAVGLIGLNSIAWLPLAGDVWELTELDGYETTIKDGYLHDIIPGDLNQDGRKDLVFLETAKHYVDMVVFDGSNRLIPANRWQVFEERSFRGTRADMPEPREAVVADITGDGKNDLLILVHDRVLLYPQE